MAIGGEKATQLRHLASFDARIPRVKTVGSLLVIDDNRLVDRAAAVRAGVGWWGKNAMVLTPGYGPWLLLGSVVVGLVLGVATLELMGDKVQHEIFRRPEVDLQVALAATLLLVVAGTTAGLFPAIKAARIRPIEALRDE